jgi:hypothetical protein
VFDDIKHITGAFEVHLLGDSWLWLRAHRAERVAKEMERI